jgi:hypothetical protein
MLQKAIYSPLAESNLLELARGLVSELFPNSFSISFSQAADWRRFCDLRNNVAFCQSAVGEKEIEKEFGNNSQTSPLASSRRLDSGLVLRQQLRQQAQHPSRSGVTPLKKKTFFYMTFGSGTKVFACVRSNPIYMS